MPVSWTLHSAQQKHGQCALTRGQWAPQMDRQGLFLALVNALGNINDFTSERSTLTWENQNLFMYIIAKSLMCLMLAFKLLQWGKGIKGKLNGGARLEVGLGERLALSERYLCLFSEGLLWKWCLYGLKLSMDQMVEAARECNMGNKWICGYGMEVYYLQEQEEIHDYILKWFNKTLRFKWLTFPAQPL